MCGIAGFYASNKHNFSKEELKNMSDSLFHRGPDAEGFYFDEYAGLGHRRLSIIDLSSEANQPIYSQNGQYVIIYNGEVYNFKDIANEIKKDYNNNFQFKTGSDTEVILEAFSKWGTQFVHKLNGMFAIAIYDIQNKELFLFRDRIGIKPLYYYWNGVSFAFASEIKALQQLKSIPFEIEKKTIRDFLQFGFVPTPNTIYKQIKKMDAGSYIKISCSGIESQKYWSITSKISNDIIDNEKQAMIMLSDLLMSSVQYQLQSDVPFGIFLSGGIDSSLIAAQASQLAGVKVNTFSIGFEETPFNESNYANAVSKYLGTNHHEFIVSHKNAIELINSVITAYDVPFGDASAIPTMLVSKLAKNHVTVALSGEGGDELFHGYGAYIWAKRLANPFIHSTRYFIHKLLSNSKDNRKIRAAQLFSYNEKENLKSHIFSQEQYYFSQNELNNYLHKDYVFQTEIDESNFIINPTILSNNSSKKKRKLTPMEQQAIFDLRYYLQDDLLRKVDIASMKFSLETRVPFLDHRIIELSLNLAPELKYKNGISKYILKEILYQYIPKKYFDRPKWGFAIPIRSWLKKEFKFLINDYLSEQIINKYGIIKYEAVKKIKTDFFNGADFLYNKIWLLIILHKWLDEKVKM